MIHGSCLCGGYRYQIDGPVLSMVNCHCSKCRKASATAYATFAVVPAASFEVTAGVDLVQTFESSPGFHRTFCKRCGSTVPVKREGLDVVYVPAGTLDTPPGLRPSSHIFVGSKAEWHDIVDDLPQYPEYPPRM